MLFGGKEVPLLPSTHPEVSPLGSNSSKFLSQVLQRHKAVRDSADQSKAGFIFLSNSQSRSSQWIKGPPSPPTDPGGEAVITLYGEGKEIPKPFRKAGGGGLRERQGQQQRGSSPVSWVPCPAGASHSHTCAAAAMLAPYLHVTLL